jgi:putative DNA primase/helicase
MPELLRSCPIPTWLRFLDRTFAGDVKLIGYVQRMLGYALTGSTREHALFFGYGTGANGKSVLISTVAGILGDNHRASPIETFTTSGGDRHPTELAALRGARLVTATETEEGRRWAESRIKALTGGDTISARFMRQLFRLQAGVQAAGRRQPQTRPAGRGRGHQAALQLDPFRRDDPEG